MSRDILLTFDTETTSAQPKSARVVQLAAVARKRTPALDGQDWWGSPQTDEVVINTLCNPGCSIHHEAQEVHGISDEMVKDKPMDWQSMKVLTEYIYDNRDRIIIGGQNVLTFDLPIMWRVAQYEPIELPVIDTLVCATRTMPNAANHKLGPLHEAMGLGSAEGAHDALTDINMVNRMIEKFGRALNMTWQQLADWVAKPRILSVCHFGKHKGRRWGKPDRSKGESPDDFVPFGYVRFIVDKFEDVSPDMKATIKHHYGLKCR